MWLVMGRSWGRGWGDVRKVRGRTFGCTPLFTFGSGEQRQGKQHWHRNLIQSFGRAGEIDLMTDYLALCALLSRFEYPKSIPHFASAAMNASDLPRHKKAT